MSKEKMIRFGIGDIVVTEEQSKKLPSYVAIYDDKGNYIAEAEIYYVEDEEDDEF
jgi:hypothetical protein